MKKKNKVKGLIEIDCNDMLWAEITEQVNNYWSNLENNLLFAFKSKEEINVDSIEDALSTKYKPVDNIEVDKVEIECPPEKGMFYYGASVIIYESGIAEFGIFD